MKFEPNYWYKMREKTFGLTSQCHILHVTKRADGIYYQIDTAEPYKKNKDDDYDPLLDTWEIVKKSQVPLMVKADRVVWTCECYDEDGDYFSFKTRGKSAASKVNQTFPAIKEGFPN